MSDVLVKDYGVGQCRHNGKHAYWIGEHWLFSYLEAGATIDLARELHRDRCTEGWGFRNPELRAFCERWAGVFLRTPILGRHPWSAIALYGRLAKRYEQSNI